MALPASCGELQPFLSISISDSIGQLNFIPGAREVSPATLNIRAQHITPDNRKVRRRDIPLWFSTTPTMSAHFARRQLNAFAIDHAVHAVIFYWLNHNLAIAGFRRNGG